MNISDPFIKKIKFYPRIVIDLDKLEGNARKVYCMCVDNNKDLMVVTKGIKSDPIIIETLMNAGITNIGDSRIEELENLEKEREQGLKLSLIRPPSVSRINSSLENIDKIYVSDLPTLKIMENHASMLKLTYNVVVILEIGDGRDGILKEELPSFLQEILKMKAIKLAGISVNYGCISGILPTEKNQKELDSIVETTFKKLDLPPLPLSSGGTVVLKLLEEKKLAKKVKEIRCGEGILLGVSTTDNRSISWLEQNTFILEAEILEIREKQSLPSGEIGLDAQGDLPKFAEGGIRKRAVVALGYSDTDINTLRPVDPQIHIIAASSDHMIVDVTDALPNYNSGEIIQFNLQYSSLLHAMLSPYVSKIYKRK